MKPNVPVFTTGSTEFAVIPKHRPLVCVKAGIPLDEALHQATLLMDLVSSLAEVVAHSSDDGPHSSNLAYTIGMLSNMAQSILADVAAPVSQLCQGQGEQP